MTTTEPIKTLDIEDSGARGRAFLRSLANTAPSPARARRTSGAFGALGPFGVAVAALYPVALVASLVLLGLSISGPATSI